MSLRLEVVCESAPDGTIGVCGADANLGEWDLSRAVTLTQQETSLQWEGDVPLPAGESDFKLVVRQAGGTQWEPLEANRRFPSRALSDGCKLMMTFGHPRIGVEASADFHQANARNHRKMEDRRGSALQENVDRKGDNAYYFAHNREFEVPEHAKVITGPGLITGGAPVLIEAGATLGTEADRTVWLKDYSWSDSTGKVKVYVPLPEGLLPADNADGIVEANFTVNQVDLTINCKPRHGLKIEKLNGELKVESCTCRVEAHKNRIVLQLAKKRETTWYNLTKK
mmetsp:Transcript_67096/g.218437  ORF Transcript_67096/g.218437 Transcript_67096/m.218437 type:complete len:283 (+) Transcript_67096:75-923(+)